MASTTRKQSIVKAAAKFSSLDLDPKQFSDSINDIKSFCLQLWKSSQNQNGDSNVDEAVLTKWIELAENFPDASAPCLKALTDLNEELVKKSVLLGNGFTPSLADVVVFTALHPSLISLPSSDRDKLPHLVRWADYIQNQESVEELFAKIHLEKAQFEPPVFKNAKKEDEGLNVKKPTVAAKETTQPVVSSKTEKNPETKKNVEKQDAPDKKKLPAKDTDEKDKELSVSLLKIQIGLIRKAEKHPSADSLLVEEIDIGEPKPRQVVSGLAKYYAPDQLTNRLVVLITNVKPSKLRDVASEGLVLCASNEDHMVVEPLIPPEGAKPGECVTFSGHDGKPEDVLNPKKKQLEKLSPHLFTDDNGVATFKGIPFMTSSGPCTSSIPRASIK